MYLLPLLCLLCATPARSAFAGTCPKKEPPPGVLVVSHGRDLVLTCSGDVEVDGVKVIRAPQRSNRGGSAAATPNLIIRNSGVPGRNDNNIMEGEEDRARSTEVGDNSKTRENGNVGYRGPPVSPTSQTVQPTSAGGLLKGDSSREVDYEDEEAAEEEGSRVTRGLKWRPEWKWNGRTVGRGHRDWGNITFDRRGASLALASVRWKDSGNYTCHQRGRQRFSVKVVIADPPENPSLSCYKRSPSSKIRCEWKPQRTVTIRPTCFLLLRKSPAKAFFPFQCSYSTQTSRCWCALKHNDDELRTVHMAYLCVTNIAGNATSAVLSFIPLNILKPDPPSAVRVQQEVGQRTRLSVTWSFPASWKPQDRYYELIYEIKYQPCMSASSHGQIMVIKGQQSYTITDALPGVKYLIQLRAKDEYDGQWSGWSTPVSASSWMESRIEESFVPLNDLVATTFSTSEGSGSDDYTSDVPMPVQSQVEVSHHIIWISGLFAVLSLFLAAYMFRYKERFMSKLHSLNIITQRNNEPAPSTSTAPEGRALVTLGPEGYKETPLSKEEESDVNEEEQTAMERTEAVHFNNTSYFLVRGK